MEYRCKVTVQDKKLFPELQEQYCAVPDSGKCPCYNVGDEFIFYRNDERREHQSSQEYRTKAVCSLPEQRIAVVKEFHFVQRRGTQSADTYIRRFKAEALCTAGQMMTG